LELVLCGWRRRGEQKEKEEKKNGAAARGKGARHGDWGEHDFILEMKWDDDFLTTSRHHNRTTAK
jgi:hypothetical protein